MVGPKTHHDGLAKKLRRRRVFNDLHFFRMLRITQGSMQQFIAEVPPGPFAQTQSLQDSGRQKLYTSVCTKYCVDPGPQLDGSMMGEAWRCFLQMQSSPKTSGRPRTPSGRQTKVGFRVNVTGFRC